MRPVGAGQTLARPHALDARVIGGERLFLIGLLAGAAILRVLALDARGFWFDEAFSAAIARSPVAQIWRLVATTDAHPPFYYLLLHAWQAFGESPVAIRSLSVLCGVLTVAVTWAFARAIGGPVLGAVAGVLMSTAALAIEASVEARMYPLLALFVVAATFLLWSAVEQPARRWLWVCYSLALSAALYVHYLAFLIIVPHVLYVLVERRGHPTVGRALLLAVAFALLLYAPWLPHLAEQVGQGRANTILSGRMPASAPVNILAMLSFGGYLLGLGGYLVEPTRWSWWQALLVLPFPLVVLVGAARMTRRGDGVLLFSLWALPMAVLIAASLERGIYYAFPRYASFVQPFFMILLARGLLSGVSRVAWSRAAVAVVLAAVVLGNLAVMRLSYADARYQPHDWAGAAQYVQQHWEDGDALILYPHTTRVAFGYYFSLVGVPVVTLFPPPSGATGAVELGQSLPSFSKVFPTAHRLWLVLAVPAPAGTAEALVQTLSLSHRRVAAKDFNYVGVFLFKKQ